MGDSKPEALLDEPTPFPWKQAMKFGFGVLHLSSQEFWSLTIPELDAAMQAHRGAVLEPVSRQWLNEAIDKHPDQNTTPLKG